jgi:hypothetical protein
MTANTGVYNINVNTFFYAAFWVMFVVIVAADIVVIVDDVIHPVINMELM